jgi:hypothetical protein
MLEIDPEQETGELSSGELDSLPAQTVAAPRRSPLMRFLRSGLGAFVILAIFLGGVITLSILGGYRAGLAERDRAATVTQSAELLKQSALADEDMAAGRYLLAAQRLQFVLAADPNYPGAAGKMATAQAALTTSQPGTSLPTPIPATPLPTINPQNAPAIFAEARQAAADQNWDLVIQEAKALQAAAPDYERNAVRQLLFDAYHARGIELINDGKLELGLTDLDDAAKIGPLDTEAQQYQQWATIYISGISYWGFNWPRTVQTFELLYTIAPYFRDTIARLHDAHVGYGDSLAAGGDPCGAALEYAAALTVTADQTTEDKRAAAESTCATGTPSLTLTPDPALFTPTPDGTLTPFPTVEGTPTVEATATETPTETATP